MKLLGKMNWFLSTQTGRSLCQWAVHFFFMEYEMKKTLLAIALVAVSSVTFAAETLTSEEDKLSYAIGRDLGSNFKQQDINVSPGAFMQGMNDSLKGDSSLMTDEEMKETLQNFQKKMMMKRVAQVKLQSDVNLKAGKEFLELNKKKEGVVTTASGLQYKVLEVGKGINPKSDDTVVVEYTGRLLDGKVFDSTEKTGKPISFNVGGVIKGWTEALQLMKPGGKMEVYIPSELAYGSRNSGGPIGPNQTLIFHIKLLSVKDKQEKAS